MNIITIQIVTIEDTLRLGQFIARCVTAGDVVCLDGDMGSGKTALCQAIARGLEVPQSCYVTSPSFALMHQYQGRLMIYHMDFYRLQDSLEVLDLGLDEYLYQNGVALIEWSERAVDILPETKLHLQISVNEDLTRSVVISGDNHFQQLFQSLSDRF